MKSIIFFGLIYLLILPLIAIACDSPPSSTTPGTTTPVTTETSKSADIDITLDQFAAEAHRVIAVEIVPTATLMVELGSNISTGYSWNNAEISDSSVISQGSRSTSGPATTMPGSGASDVWTFKAIKAGTSTIKFSYGRPWEGGEKDLYTLQINVTVK